MEHAGRAVQSPLQRMEHALSPWVGFVVVPVFALANAGIDLTAVAWQGANWSEDDKVNPGEPQSAHNVAAQLISEACR